MEGSAVRSLTTIFFQMWNIATHNADPAYEAYLNAPPAEDGGYFQPYADGPANNPKNPALDLIRQAAGGARKYLWMTSPYLVIDQELSADFSRAARGGIDVRIIMPAKPDHWYVGLLNWHNYRHLLRNGVRIYEYTPGFIHGKLLVFDDKCATVGSVNLDFRSLYLHYENGVLICDDPAVLDVKADIERTMAVSREITLEDVNARPVASQTARVAVQPVLAADVRRLCIRLPAKPETAEFPPACERKEWYRMNRYKRRGRIFWGVVVLGLAAAVICQLCGLFEWDMVSWRLACRSSPRCSASPAW